MKKQQKSIGILGGMGPDASLKLYELMIEKSRKDFRAVNNDDYPNIIMHSLPVPDFIFDKEKSLEALEMLKESTRHLSQESMVMGIACNTVHLFIDELREESEAPFVSMIEEVGNRTVRLGYKKIGLLATPTTLESNLYQDMFKKLKIEVVAPNEKQTKKLGKIIHQIIGGNFKNTSVGVVEIANSLVKKRTDAIVLGCTELPLVFPKKYHLNSINSLEVLADSLLNLFYKNQTAH
jgi:aspartate racemase